MRKGTTTRQQNNKRKQSKLQKGATNILYNFISLQYNMKILCIKYSKRLKTPGNSDFNKSNANVSCCPFSEP